MLGQINQQSQHWQPSLRQIEQGLFLGLVGLSFCLDAALIVGLQEDPWVLAPPQLSELLLDLDLGILMVEHLFKHSFRLIGTYAGRIHRRVCTLHGKLQLQHHNHRNRASCSYLRDHYSGPCHMGRDSYRCPCGYHTSNDDNHWLVNQWHRQYHLHLSHKGSSLAYMMRSSFALWARTCYSQNRKYIWTPWRVSNHLHCRHRFEPSSVDTTLTASPSFLFRPQLPWDQPLSVAFWVPFAPLYASSSTLFSQKFFL